jgi:uncharacterized protein YecE (DUF72 family)
MIRTSNTDPRGTIRFGTSSFSSNDWVGSFYPAGTQPADFLKEYAKHFDTVEVDFTYYAIPSVRTVESWAEKVEDGFLIAAKFPRDVVHGGADAKPDRDKVLQSDAGNAVRDRFLSVMSHLGDHLGTPHPSIPLFQ